MNRLAFGLNDHIQHFLKEDGVGLDSLSYLNQLPRDLVEGTLHIKSSGILAGLEFFWSVFQVLDPNLPTWDFHLYEARSVEKNFSIKIPVRLPFAVALTGERVALNLLQRSSAIATSVNFFVEKAKPLKISILDTRKTTPGLRWLEKYAVLAGGGYNHRFNQSDVWMIKDNHKQQFGGVENAFKFFNDLRQPYKNIVIEIHDLAELKKALDLGCEYLMLDNFTPAQIIDAVKMKKPSSYYEVSGGINELTIDQYLIPGIDAISIGKVTQFPSPFDISFKYKAV